MRPSVAPSRAGRWVERSLVERSDVGPLSPINSLPANPLPTAPPSAPALREALRPRRRGELRHAVRAAAPGTCPTVGCDHPAHSQPCQGPQVKVVHGIIRPRGRWLAVRAEDPPNGREPRCPGATGGDLTPACAPANQGQASEQTDRRQDAHVCWREGRHRGRV
jgi:hypothetical protein